MVGRPVGEGRWWVVCREAGVQNSVQNDRGG